METTMAATCSMVGCVRFAGPDGLCNVHRRAPERFWSKVDENGPILPAMTTPCWMWTGQLFKKDRYGVFYIWGETPWRAHRYAWAITRGAIPNGLQVLHACDNRVCVRPDHLFLGTHSDNMRDMHAKGRGRTAESYARGERNHRARLTADDVRTIRSRHANGENATRLANEYRIGRTTIGHLLARRTWTDV